MSTFYFLKVHKIFFCCALFITVITYAERLCYLTILNRLVNLLLLTPVFSSLKRSPSMAMLMIIRCLCSPAALIAIFKSDRASWHMRSPRASDTSKIPINFALKLTPSPRKRDVSFLSVKKNRIVAIVQNLVQFSFC